jgi:hypothetical protein
MAAWIPDNKKKIKETLSHPGPPPVYANNYK